MSVGGTDGETVLVPHDGSAITMTPARYSTYTVGVGRLRPMVVGVSAD